MTYLWSFADPSDGIVLRSEDGTATVVWNRSTGTLRVQAMLTETPFCASDCATLDVQSPFGASYAIAVVGSSAMITSSMIRVTLAWEWVWGEEERIMIAVGC